MGEAERREGTSSLADVPFHRMKPVAGCPAQLRPRPDVGPIAPPKFVSGRAFQRVMLPGQPFQSGAPGDRLLVRRIRRHLQGVWLTGSRLTSPQQESFTMIGLAWKS